MSNPQDDVFAPVPPGWKPRQFPGKTLHRFWRHKETKADIEIRRYLYVADANEFRVVVYDPQINRQFTMTEAELRRNYEIAPGYMVREVATRVPGGAIPLADPTPTSGAEKKEKDKEPPANQGGTP